MTRRVPVAQLMPGARVYPPAREVSLWMRRDLLSRGLPESALIMTVVSVRDGAPDKGGPWCVVEAMPSAEWSGDHAPRMWTWKARPSKLWPVEVDS